MRNFAALALIAILTAAPAVSDDRSGVFLGISGGQADVKETIEGLDLDQFDVDVQVDDISPAWGASGGYQFNRFFGARFGFVDFQTFDDLLDVGDIEDAPDIDIDLEGWMMGVDAYLPLSRWMSLAARAGYMDWQSRLKVGDLGLEESDSGTDPFFGGGMEMNVGDNVGLDLSYTRFDVDGSNVDYASVGVRLRF